MKECNALVMIRNYTSDGLLKKSFSKICGHIYYEVINMRQDGLTLPVICQLLNNNDFGFYIKEVTFNNCMARIKKNPPTKQAQIGQVKPVEQVKPMEDDERAKRMERNRAAEQKRKEELDAIDISKELLYACFQKRPLAVQCIGNDISIELVKSWGCGNFFQLSNQINGYIMNQKGKK
ncbi:MAG: hypothetical protein ACRC9M_01070 [Aeromonas sp.]